MPNPDQAPTIYLHIGRNKAGSTTLQEFFAAQAHWLSAHGVDYVLHGHMRHTGGGLRNAASMSDALAALRAGNRSILVSDEMISAFPAAISRAAAQQLRGADVQVLLYVRPYRDWVRSSYGFDVRIGYNARDFDAYLGHIGPAISFWPNLRIWGDTLGWDRLRVRSTASRDLQGGTLALDCLAAMGVPPPAAPPPDPSNTMPNWIAIELLRLAAAGHADAGWTYTGRAIAEALHELADEALVAAGNDMPPAHYLTPAQSRDLAALYNRDLADLARHSGTRLQPDDAGDPPERPFLPAAGYIPPIILRRIAERASSAEYARLHPEAAAFVASSAFTGLLALRPAGDAVRQVRGRNQERTDMSLTLEPSAPPAAPALQAAEAADGGQAAFALAASGDLPGAIKAALLALRDAPDAALATALVRWRLDAFATAAIPAGPQDWPPALADPFPGETGIPCIEASALTAAVLGGAILHHGLLRVNGLISGDSAERLRQGVDTALAARDAYQDRGTMENDGWYAPVDVPMLGFKRAFVEQCGALWAADSPRMLHNVIDLYRSIGLIDCIAAFMGEPPALSVRKTTFRRVPVTTSTDWHQDGAFLGRKTRAVNVWLALSACGEDAPGLDVVARRLPYIVQTGSHGAAFDWSVGPGLVSVLAEGGAPVVSPAFAPGDALLFDHMMLHRTGIRAGMARERYAIESWFFAPTEYPLDQVALYV